MHAVSNPLALAALNRALKAVKAGPTPRPKVNSRIADKFSVRGYAELYAELDGIGQHQGRSRNSEAIAAIIDALGGQVRSMAMLKSLRNSLGDEVSDRVLATVKDFDLSACKQAQQYVLRFPPNVRDTIKAEVEEAAGQAHSMNQWMLNAFVMWINVQRKHFALLTTVISMDQVGLDSSST